jgi:hypothetical protein
MHHQAAVQPPHARLVRAGLAVASVALLILTFGFLTRADWALRLWPLAEGPLGYRFIGSILLAQATALGWTAVTLELNYGRGGTVGYAAMNLGFALFAAARYRQSPDPLMLGWLVACGVLCVGGLILFFLGRDYPKRNAGPVPGLVRWSFLVLSAALTVATVMLLARAPIVFPWPLKPETSILFGLFYFASITYFFDGWWRPAMGNCLGQLAAFFMYDIVLIPPYLKHWPKAHGGFRISLAIYLAVLIWTTLLAVWIWGRYLADRGARKSA